MAPAVTVRSRRSSDSKALMRARGGSRRRTVSDDSVIVQVQMRELRIALLQFDGDLPARAARSGDDLRDLVLEAARQVDACPLLGAGDGIADGLPIDIESILDAHFAAPRLDVHLEFDRRKNRLEYLLERRREHGEHGREGVRVLARDDLEERLALLGARARVDEYLRLAVALVNSSLTMA